MDEQNSIDIDEVRSMHSTIERMGRSLAAVTQEAEYWKIKATGLQENFDKFQKTLVDAGVNLEGIFSPNEEGVVQFPVEEIEQDGD